MIWSDDFVWLHFPKCAGTKTENLFRRYYRDLLHIHQDPVDIALDPSASWHHSLAEREHRSPGFATGNRLVICPIRRLPGWLESRYNFEVARTPHLDHRPTRLLTGRFLHANGEEGHAENVARRYLPDPLLASPRLTFIRTESFEADFRRVFAPFLDLDRIPAAEFGVFENAAPDRLPPGIRQRLWHDNVSLYAECPRWRRIEQLAYGEGGGLSAADRPRHSG
ncbi:hypothetical protein [Methylotetracoccus oryzae]|uniref:hypothetical protein n=1 Tax=Methylotetracoccus oryzae TaxID=1919059 RepID=UPI00111B33FC|nr:hypothetical protein [Methylotetracoccus oryzae]